MSSAIRIVLVDTSHPGNIGASARAMKNMGLESLVLVRPGSHPDPEAEARASGAADVLARARVVASVDQAIGDCGLVLGATARARSAHWRELDARARRRRDCGGCRQPAGRRPVRRRAQWPRNEELERCEALIRIPVAADYGSLNLAQAVQIVCYEVRIDARRVRSGRGRGRRCRRLPTSGVPSMRISSA